jgi:CRISPR type III-A-associated RAMP protein Csm5
MHNEKMNLNTEHKIKLTTLTPLSILADSGRDLSPYADYIVSEEGDSLYYVNHRQVENVLAQKPQLIDEYVAGIKDSMDNNRSNFNLSHFLTNKLGLDIEDFDSVPAQGKWRGKKRNIQAVVKDAGRLYLPGSSLKGAMRTAMLYCWLAYDESGEVEIQKIVKAIAAIAPKCERLNVLKKKKNFQLTDSERRDKKELERERTKAIADIFNEEVLFGKLNPRRDEPQIAPLSQHIVCRDSKSVGNKYLIATQAERIRRLPENKEFSKGKGSVIPMPREAVAANAPFETSFTIRNGVIPDDSPIAYLNGDTEGIIKTLNDFALDFVNFEIERLEEGDGNADLQYLTDFYYNLQERIANGETFLRIGSGKTFYDNSLVLTLLMHPDETIKTESAKQLRTIFRNDIKSLHPVTRTIAADGYPFGWVKVDVL